jgi:hypothetical protein
MHAGDTASRTMELMSVSSRAEVVRSSCVLAELSFWARSSHAASPEYYKNGTVSWKNETPLRPKRVNFGFVNEKTLFIIRHAQN